MVMSDPAKNPAKVAGFQSNGMLNFLLGFVVIGSWLFAFCLFAVSATLVYMQVQPPKHEAAVAFGFCGAVMSVLATAITASAINKASGGKFEP